MGTVLGPREEFMKGEGEFGRVGSISLKMEMSTQTWIEKHARDVRAVSLLVPISTSNITRLWR